MSDYHIYDGKLYHKVSNPLVEGSVEINIEEKAPLMLWKGAKIPLDLFNEVNAFFLYSYEKYKSETQVRLFYNTETKEWKAWALPQYRGTGMVTDEIEEHENKAEDMRQFNPSNGWLCMGSIHHHCSTSAFQSGGDHQNEKNQDGIHITVGHLNRDKLDIHARAVMLIAGELDENNRVVQKAIKCMQDIENFADWFESPGGLERIPIKWHHEVIKDVLTTKPIGDAEFPARWMENLIEKPKPKYAQGTYGSAYFNRDVSSYGKGGFWRNGTFHGWDDLEEEEEEKFQKYEEFQEEDLEDEELQVVEETDCIDVVSLGEFISFGFRDRKSFKDHLNFSDWRPIKGEPDLYGLPI